MGDHHAPHHRIPIPTQITDLPDVLLTMISRLAGAWKGCSPSHPPSHSHTAANSICRIFRDAVRDTDAYAAILVDALGANRAVFRAISPSSEVHCRCLGRRGGGADGLLARLVEHEDLTTTDLELALIVACSSGRDGAVRVLLSCGAKAPSANGPGGRPLVSAARHGRDEVVTTLLTWPDRPARDDCLLGDALLAASTQGHDTVVRLLLESPHPPRANSQGNRALKAACKGGHHKVVRLLLSVPKHAPDVDDALREAMADGQTEVVRAILPFIPADRPMLRIGRLTASAANAGHLELTRMLIDASEPSRQTLNSILDDVIWLRHSVDTFKASDEAVAMLSMDAMQRSGDVCTADDDDRRTRELKKAASQGRDGIVALLLEKHRYASPVLGDAAVEAARNGHCDVVDMLMRRVL